MDLFHEITVCCVCAGEKKTRWLPVELEMLEVTKEFSKTRRYDDYLCTLIVPYGATSIMKCDLPFCIDFAEWNSIMPTEFKLISEVYSRVISLWVYSMYIVDQQGFDPQYNIKIMYTPLTKIAQVFVDNMGYIIDHASFTAMCEDTKDIFRFINEQQGPEPHMIVKTDMENEVVMENFVSAEVIEVPVPYAECNNSIEVNVHYETKDENYQYATGIIQDCLIGLSSYPAYDELNATYVALPVMSYYDLISRINSEYRGFIGRIIKGLTQVLIIHYRNGVGVFCSGYDVLRLFVPGKFGTAASVFISFASCYSFSDLVTRGRYKVVYLSKGRCNNGDLLLLWSLDPKKQCLMTTDFEYFDEKDWIEYPCGYYRTSRTSIDVRSRLSKLLVEDHQYQFVGEDFGCFSHYVREDYRCSFKTWMPILTGSMYIEDPKDSKILRIGCIAQSRLQISSGDYLETLTRLGSVLTVGHDQSSSDVLKTKYRNFHVRLRDMENRYKADEIMNVGSMAMSVHVVLLADPPGTNDVMFPEDSYEFVNVICSVANTPLLWSNNNILRLIWPNKFVISMDCKAKTYIFTDTGPLVHDGGSLVYNNVLQLVERVLKKHFSESVKLNGMMRDVSHRVAKDTFRKYVYQKVLMKFKSTSPQGSTSR